MKYLDWLIPSFLKKIDQYLLTHYPVIWETKVHYFVFYSLILTNTLAISAGLIYPINQHTIPAYSTLVDITEWSFVSAGLVLFYYAFHQSFNRKPIYTFSEIVLKSGIYLFCTFSLFLNTLVFPNTLSYKVRQIYPENNLLKDLRTYARQDYLANLARHAYYHPASEIRATHAEDMTILYEHQNERYDVIQEGKEAKEPNYKKVLKNSTFNQNGDINYYYQLFENADELLPLPSHEEVLEYAQRKEKLKEERQELKDWREANRRVRFYEVFAHLKSYRRKVAQSIRKHPKWQKEFKDRLVRQIYDMPEFIFSLQDHFGKAAPVLIQHPGVQGLQEKYVRNYHPETATLTQLNEALADLMRYHYSDLLLVSIYPKFEEFSDRGHRVEFYGDLLAHKLERRARSFQPYYYDLNQSLYYDSDTDSEIDQYSETFEEMSLDHRKEAYGAYLHAHRLNSELKDLFSPLQSIPQHWGWEGILILSLSFAMILLSASTYAVGTSFGASAGLLLAYALSQVLLYSSFMYPWRDTLGIAEYRFHEYYNLVAPQTLIVLSLILGVYLYFYRSHRPWQKMLLSAMMIGGILSGLGTYFQLMQGDYLPWVEVQFFGLGEVFYLYALLFVCNMCNYWHFNRVISLPKVQ